VKTLRLQGSLSGSRAYSLALEGQHVEFS
jgi:hypothetical protein